MAYITFFQFLHCCFLLDAGKYTSPREILTETRSLLGTSKKKSTQSDSKEQTAAEGLGPPPD